MLTFFIRLLKINIWKIEFWKNQSTLCYLGLPAPQCTRCLLVLVEGEVVLKHMNITVSRKWLASHKNISHCISLKHSWEKQLFSYQTTSAVWAGALKQKAGYFQSIAICFQNKTKTWVLKQRKNWSANIIHPGAWRSY